MHFPNPFARKGVHRVAQQTGRLTNGLVPLQVNKGELLLFAACDAAYFKYAKALIRSVDLFSPGQAFLLHLVNPSEALCSEVTALAASLEFTRLGVSSESIELTGWPVDQQRTYYACSRFLQLPAVLADTGAGAVLCLDADSLVVNPIDGDFTDKADADVVIDLRDTDNPAREHVAVAAGAVWLRSSAEVQKFTQGLGTEIASMMAEGHMDWFTDQLVFYRQMRLHAKSVRFFNLKRKYLDWNFSEDSIVWSAKGKRKDSDVRFLVLSLLLGDEAAQHHAAQQLLCGLSGSGSALMASKWLLQRIARAAPRPAQVALFVPRLDLPWKRARTPGVPPALAEDTLGLRLRWKEFAIRMAHALETQGLAVEVLEIPADEIDPARVDACNADLALIPHRCHLDWPASGKTPVYFYMQEYFRWVFTVDPKGWSAASSIYPVRLGEAKSASDTFDTYRHRLLGGGWASKFSQSPQRSSADLLASGELPFAPDAQGVAQCRPFIFLPLQIPHDQSIRYFSPIEEIDMVQAVVNWARANKVALVMKPHPANKKAMRQFETFVDHQSVFWSEANINDLLGRATAVYTINSGVGFEALLHCKPVVTFGRAEYDCVTFHATTDLLDTAWDHCLQSERTALEKKYRHFVNWFLDDYAIDMSRPEQASRQLMALANQIRSKIQQGHRGGT
ncbi:hypothetical protein [Polaromonas sp. YR568]|uniref:capsular polysaccharide export protein, LipB/KpsS family n=1 Tax=Polaromonas sp. YR568 TaxID=1855301 RepID=UPI003137EDE1